MHDAVPPVSKLWRPRAQRLRSSVRVRRHLLVDDTVMVDDSMVVDDTMRVDHPMVFDYIMEVDNTVVTLRLLDWSECVWRGARHACEFHRVLYVVFRSYYEVHTNWYQ